MSESVLFVVRAVVADASMRIRFDRWYGEDHLPWAMTVFGCDKAWRAWSSTDPSVHYAVYRFAGMDALNDRLGSDGFKALVADFDRTWPAGVTRSREVLTLVDSASGAAQRAME